MGKIILNGVDYSAAATAGVTGVKGGVESKYRTGNVNLTPEDIGALPVDGDSTDNTVSFISRDAEDPEEWTDVDTIESGEKHNSVFEKISTMFKNIRYLKKMLVTLNTDIGKGANWQKVSVSPTFSINNNATGNTAVLRCLFSPFLNAYLIEYYIAFTTLPATDGKVYLNTKLELINPQQTPAQVFGLISQVNSEAYPYPGVPSIAKYCQNGEMWFELSFTNNASMPNTVVRACGSVLIPQDVDLW